MPGWRDRVAAASRHPSAQNHSRTPLKALEEQIDEHRKRGQDAWGLRYGQEVDGMRQGGEDVAAEWLQEEMGWDFVPDLHMPMPGTPEFAARYIQPPEPIIEQIEAVGPEGFRIVRRVDGVTGELIEEASEVIGNLGPGEIVPGA